ncbi:MAG TPA: peptide-methionine (S)-S-oxide reductase MsrA [Niabella sp.]|mgnify:CR=1 FL=1|nr:peptide-methionine (S)-S-oxide reductase MsrA [Niabella sp.]HOZ97546.1 peptide-methionine (S)-S-oxide reductase MsrA [Niabella sp.]HQW15634.1 peptide-methionine (S)-S-oxide reductase MsrA [Niabella sp.]HQX20777.1 peptide-methionine (S)-S-oxide reductase MsrA [Niabella sp.]HQX41376.1 peptide-methionine (S)-S-oxide reductase MsrA [Niabella sp.]
MKQIIPALFICLFALGSCSAQEDPKKDVVKFTRPDKSKIMIHDKKDTATFANGCFWCTEAIFQEVKGVEKVTSGYTDGRTENPTYEEVCSGSTGYAEALQIVFDPAVISFDELLEVFWKTHDPTTLNRQGNDVGTQYRSGIYYHNEAQREKADFYKTALDSSGAFDHPIVTEIKPYRNFYAAEGYHQSYFSNNENKNPYCKIVIRPKVDKFRLAFKDKLK